MEAVQRRRPTLLDSDGASAPGQGRAALVARWLDLTRRVLPA